MSGGRPEKAQRGRLVIKLAIVVFWIAMMSLLVYRNAREAALGPFASPLTEADFAGDEAWYGIYLVSGDGNDEIRSKIGYSHTVRTETAGGYQLLDETRLRLVVQNDRKSVNTTLEAEVDPYFNLQSFDFMLTSDMMKFEVSGTVQDSELEVLIKAGGSIAREIVPLTGEAPGIPANLTQRLAAQGLEVGRSYRFDFYDPSSRAFAGADARVVDRETIRFGEIDQDVYRVLTDFKGIPITSWIDAQGNVLKERGANMLRVREAHNYALARGWDEDVPLDIIDFLAVKADRPIDDPRDVTRLSVRIEGVDVSDLPLADSRQTVHDDGTLEIRAEDVANIASYELPYAGDELREFLASTSTIQSDDPDIVAAVKGIVGDRTDAMQAALVLHEWVFENIEKKPIVSIPSAKYVFDIRKGDCNEHAALLTAMARAAGIPAKILVGVVYNDGSFYYHAWNALWIGEWVAADATFGQFPADATHIKLLEGDLDQQVAVARLAGRMSIKVVDYE